MRGTDRPSLLYITPVTPADAGNGLAMRSANVLRALVQHYDVTVLILPIYPSGPSGKLPNWLKKSTTKIHRAPSAAPLRNKRFDVVHLFRMATLPYVEDTFTPENVGAWHIDLDDVESQLGNRSTAGIERRLLETWDRVYVCSEADRSYLTGMTPTHRAEVVVLPNSVALPRNTTPLPGGNPRQLLMAGTMSYRPNAEGAIWFCREVLPIIREQTPVPVSISLVGTGPPADVRELGYIPEVRHIGPVPVMDPWYDRADIVIAPILEGGGTRIKILEALAYRRPVVSTTVGAKGLDLRNGHELLIADRPQPFAQHCLRLIREPQIGQQIAAQGRDVVEALYSHEQVAANFIPSTRMQPR